MDIKDFKMITTAPTGVRLMLPWPDPILNPNNKQHWRAKLEAKQAARSEAFAIAYNLHTKLDPEKYYQVDLVFCPPNNRPRDLDNLLSSMKSQIDGACFALGINDRMIRPTLDWGPVVEGGKVEVTITERTLKNLAGA
jgi:hypothetical protein